MDDTKETEGKTYFETNGEQLLQDAGLSNAQFAEKMGITPTNVPQLFKTKNILRLKKAAEILGKPVSVLVDGDTLKYHSRLTIMGCVWVRGKAYMIGCEDDIRKLLSTISELKE